MIDFEKLANKGVVSLSPYVGGKDSDELARELGLQPKEIVKLASNESPLGSSPQVEKALVDAIKDLSRYPDGNGFHLKTAIAELNGVSLDTITLGNGSSDLLHFMVDVFCGAEDHIVFSEHAFALYKLIAVAKELDYSEVDAKDYGHDLPAMASAIRPKTKLVFVTNPNNPTGTGFSHDEFLQFMEAVPAHVFVVLDEAYYEFAVVREDYPKAVDLMVRYPNLVITRTFSKVYGLAGLRVGYGLAHPKVTDLMNRIRPPFNVNKLGLIAAEAAINDQQFVDSVVVNNQHEMSRYEKAFDELGLTYIPSQANFITVNVGEKASEMVTQLMSVGVTVRGVAGYGLPEFIRISIGAPDENSKCIDHFRRIVLQEQSN